MPKIEQTQTIEITAERFLNACSPAELFDIDRLIQQPRYQSVIKHLLSGVIDEHSEDVSHKRLYQFKYVCTVCKVNQVDADNGVEICQSCLANAWPNLPEPNTI